MTTPGELFCTYNALLSNGASQSTFGNPVWAVYNDNRTSAIISSARDWDVCCSRVQIDGAGRALPLWQPIVATGQPLVDMTIYQCGLSATWRGLVGAPPLGNITIISGTNDKFQSVSYDSQGSIIATTTNTIPADIYTLTTLLAAIQTTLRGNGDPAFAACTVTSTLTNKLVLEPGTVTGVTLCLDWSASSAVSEPQREQNAVAMGGVDGVAYKTNGAGQLILPNAVFGGGAAAVESPVFNVSYPIRWVPENSGAATPQAPTTVQDLSTGYYDGQTYSHFCHIANEAWAMAINDATSPWNGTPGTPTTASLQGQLNAWWVAAGYPGSPPTWRTRPPEFQYQPGSSLFTASFDTWAFSGSAPGQNHASAGLIGPDNEEAMTPYINEGLYSLLGSFALDSQSYNTGGDGHDYALRLDDADAGTLSDGTPCLVVTQDYPSTDQGWSQIASIVVTSNLPISAEAFGPPQPYASSNIATPPPGGAAYNNVLVDFSLDEVAANYKTSMTYAPTVLRWASCISDVEIRQISLQFWTLGRLTGLLSPLLLPPQASILCKIQFRRKHVSA
jgi:hypothetical protein